MRAGKKYKKRKEVWKTRKEGTNELNFLFLNSNNILYRNF